MQPIQKEAVYRIDAQSGNLEKVTDEIYKPNGLCFSPDYKKLYVPDTGATHYPDARKIIKVWDIVSDKKKTFGRYTLLVLWYFQGSPFLCVKIKSGKVMLCTIGGLGIWYVMDSFIVLFGEFTDTEGRKIKDWV